MIQEPNMSVEKTHSLGAVLKGAFLLFFLVFGVATYAQSYNSQVSYRVNGAAQSSVSAEQWSGYGVSNGAYRVAESDCRQVEEMGYKSYRSTVYQPFGSSLPSGMGNGSRGMSGRRNAEGEDDWGENDWGEGGDSWGNDGEDADINDPQDNSTQSPIGEPWILLLFAAVAAFFIARRKRQVA